VFVGSGFFYQSKDNKLYCLDASNGNLVWSYTTGGCIASSPVIVKGQVFVGSDDKKMYCFGKPIPEYETIIIPMISIVIVTAIIRYKKDNNQKNGYR
jgi:hypothetical protein